MPNWQPNWENVHWNYAAADRAANQLDRTADELGTTSSARQQVATEATAEWRGVFRTRFELQLGGTLREAWNLAGAFREAAARIRQATQWAREEQARRERDRERWRQEKEREDAERRAGDVRKRAEKEKAAQAAPKS